MKINLASFPGYQKTHRHCSKCNVLKSGVSFVRRKNVCLDCRNGCAKVREKKRRDKLKSYTGGQWWIAEYFRISTIERRNAR